MQSRRLAGFLITLALVAAGCGQAAPQAGSTSPPAAKSTAPAPATSPAALASPSALAPERVDGVVQSVTGNQVMLSNGRGFSLASSARVLRSMPITAADLQPGQYVAITAKRQPDNTLLASIVSIFPESMGQVAPGQRPLPAGDLMTNATIDQVQGDSFTVSFPGGGARVQLAPDARVERRVEASASDISPGDNVVAQVLNGEAQTVSIQPGGSSQPSGSPGAAPAAGSMTVQLRTDPNLGSILADNQGRTLYRFDRDTRDTSNCSGGCAQNWPPLLLPSGDPTGPAELPGKLATIARADGGRQVTYSGLPLYTYAQDTQPGDTKGEGVGGVWHVVHPTDTAP
jgi:predicted lipoprotein with Yx(FWY)xxD motif